MIRSLLNKVLGRTRPATYEKDLRETLAALKILTVKLERALAGRA